MTVRSLLLLHQNLVQVGIRGVRLGKGPRGRMYGPVNSGLKVKVQVKLQCKCATCYQITGQGGCSEEIVPWPLGRSSCHGMATLLQEPGAGVQRCREVARAEVLSIPGSVRGGPPLVFTHPGGLFPFTQEETIPVPEEQNWLLLPSSVTVYHHWSAPSLCSRTGAPKSCAVDRYAC